MMKQYAITGAQIIIIIIGELFSMCQYFAIAKNDNSPTIFYLQVYICMDLVIQIFGTGQLMMIFQYMEKKKSAAGTEKVMERSNARNLVIFWGVVTILLHTSSLILGFTGVDPVYIYQVFRYFLIRIYFKDATYAISLHFIKFMTEQSAYLVVTRTANAKADNRFNTMVPKAVVMTKAV